MEPGTSRMAVRHTNHYQTGGHSWMIPLLKFQYVFALAVNLGQLHKCVCGLDADVCHHALTLCCLMVLNSTKKL